MKINLKLLLIYVVFCYIMQFVFALQYIIHNCFLKGYAWLNYLNLIQTGR